MPCAPGPWHTVTITEKWRGGGLDPLSPALDPHIVDAQVFSQSVIPERKLGVKDSM